jgi:hypothetical protein
LLLQTRSVDDDAPGHDPGHGFSWAEYVDWLVHERGSLAGVAKALGAHRAWQEDVVSIERALRRLRTRGQLDGGQWGERALAMFGLPGAIDARVQWIGAYHSRFTDLPVPVCEDLIRVWDRPPVNTSIAGACWLAAAHATLCLRRNEVAAAAGHIARAPRKRAPAEARIELTLIEAFIVSRKDEAAATVLLEGLTPLMKQTSNENLRARWIDQRAYSLSRANKHVEAVALYSSIPANGPPFARCRRENGLAYAKWKLKKQEAAITHAHEACAAAGDGGHVRLRAMALSVLGKVLGAPDGDEAQRRAQAIATALHDEGLRLRFERHRAPREE